MSLHLLEVQEVLQCDLIELNPAVADILTLLLLEGSLTLLLASEEDGPLSGATVILVPPDFNTLRLHIILSEESEDVLILEVKGQATKPHPCIVSHLHYINKPYPIIDALTVRIASHPL